LPVVLAGGLNPENVKEAIESASPDAVDVSSGVEASPGIKDIKRVELFISRAKAVEGLVRRVHRVFD
jgi:phosphoribosylanthranilate isomerase